MGEQRNSAVSQQSGHAPRSRPEIKRNVSFVVWEDVGVPVGIVGIEVGKIRGISVEGNKRKLCTKRDTLKRKIRANKGKNSHFQFGYQQKTKPS